MLARLAPVLLGVFVLPLGACTDDPSPEEVRARFVASLADDLVTETDGALDDQQSACVADALVTAIGMDAIDQLGDAVVDDTDDDIRRTVVDAFAGCDALTPLLEATGG